jgi:ADP-ribosylglycohydrolase
MAHPQGLYYHCGQQVLLATGCILEGGDIGGEEYARACANLATPSKRGKFGLHRRPSQVFRVAVGKILDGTNWRESGEESSRTDCIPAALVPGLVSSTDADGLTKRAAEIALVTDRTVFGVMSAVALAHATALLVEHDRSVLPGELLGELLERLPAAREFVESTYGEEILSTPEEFAVIEELLSSLPLHWVGEVGEEEDRIAAASLAATIARLTARKSKRLNAGFAPAGVAAALYLALTEKKSPDRAILRAVGMGGSTAALGALTGGLAGALWGRHAFPAEWIEVLWNHAEALRMAERLARGGEGPSWCGDLHDLESESARKIQEFKDDLREELLSGPKKEEPLDE